MGLDSREVTPELTRVVVQLSAKIRSFSRAEVTVERVLGNKVSDSTIRRLTKQVGKELENLEQLDERNDGKEVVTPEVAVVSCDGGRIRSRQPGQGRGVRLSGENGWRETKNASLPRPIDLFRHSIAGPRNLQSLHKLNWSPISPKSMREAKNASNELARRNSDNASMKTRRRVIWPNQAAISQCRFLVSVIRCVRLTAKTAVTARKRSKRLQTTD